MSIVEKIKEQLEFGTPILEKLFKMPSAELKSKLTEICESRLSERELEVIKEGRVYKTSVNDEPDKIEIWSYDGITIGALGISYKPEHGSSKKIVEFDKFFKLD
ncbi:MAG: hypothetical protein AABY15_03115 [Nanoarchaeota archaeon]